MIEKLVIRSIGDDAHLASLMSLTWIKMNEVIDVVNAIDALFMGLQKSKPVGVHAKLEMHRATLDDLEEELRKGSI